MAFLPTNHPGPVKISHREILRLAAPFALSNLTIPLLEMADTAVVRHLPEPEYLGAVAIGSAIFNFLFWLLLFLRMGTTGIIAQAYGRGDHTVVYRVPYWGAFYPPGICSRRGEVRGWGPLFCCLCWPGG